MYVFQIFHPMHPIPTLCDAKNAANVSQLRLRRAPGFDFGVHFINQMAILLRRLWALEL